MHFSIFNFQFSIPSGNATAIALLAAALASPPALAQPEPLPRGVPVDLSFLSAPGNTPSPYTVYLPKSLPANLPIPLVVVLHGTNGDHRTFFESTRYDPTLKKFTAAAEKHGLAILCPKDGDGRTCWWGIGEYRLFAALEDFRKRAPVDPDRIYLTGHSMGGGGTAYNALRHPDVFAAAATLVGTLPHGLAENARHTPFYLLVGEREIEPRRRYVRALAEKMQAHGCDVTHEVVPGADHYNFVADSWDRVFAFLTTKRRVANPAHITHTAGMPGHGRAWWLSLDAFERPGAVARIDARREENFFTISTENLAAFRLLPHEAGIAPITPLRLDIDGQSLETEPAAPGFEFVFKKSPTGWTVQPQGPAPHNPATYRAAAIANNPGDLDQEQWLTDALRTAAGTDFAFHTFPHTFGRPIPSGPVTEHDLAQCVLPGLGPLCTLALPGQDILDIIETNSAGPRSTLVIAGLTPSIDPDETYTLCLRETEILRNHLVLPKDFTFPEYKILPTWNHTAYYGHAVNQGTLTTTKP